MGADENSILKKCGEILINIKLKTKTYTFNCVFCNENWDQFKKFSSHLEVKHFYEISEESEEESLILEPEIKQEHDKILTDSETIEIHKDPLDPIEFATTSISNAKETLDNVMVKDERENVLNSDDNGMDFEDALEYKEEDLLCLLTKKGKKPIKERQLKTKKIESSDDASDDSNDTDFDIQKELKKSKKPLKPKTNSKKYKKSKSIVKTEPVTDPESELFSESERELIKALFEALENYKFLYDDNEKKRIKDKPVLEKGYEQIAHQVNEKLNMNITAEIANKHLSTMRIKYSYELEKQRNGEPHHIPWYAEHMKFLEKSVDATIKSRMRKRVYRMTKVDESKLHIYIEMYKKNENLWNVKNLAFGVPAKRNDSLQNILDDLKTNHAIDIDNATLNEYIKYINNLYSNDRKLQLQCELENTEFIAKSKFYKDLGFLGDSQGPFRCPYCNEFIQRYDNYHVHVSNHTSIIPFKCQLCEMGFKKFDKLIIHAKRHLGIHNYHCNICGKGYPFKSEYDFHMTSHTGDKPFLCQICGAGFKSLNLYDSHVRRHDNRFRHQCHICKKGFNQLHLLKDHVASHLNIRDHICNICGKSFTAAKYLLYHKRIHDNTKRYECEDCGKLFAQSEGLRQHRKQHQPHLSAAEIKIKNEALLDDLNF